MSVIPAVDLLNTDADIITIARLTKPAKPSAITTSRFEKRSKLRRSRLLRAGVLFWVNPECRYSVCGIIVAPTIPTARVIADLSRPRCIATIQLQDHYYKVVIQ